MIENYIKKIKTVDDSTKPFIIRQLKPTEEYRLCSLKSSVVFPENIEPIITFKYPTLLVFDIFYFNKSLK